jgi:hypothetical protein
LQQLNEQIREADAKDPNDLWTAFWIALGAEKVVTAFVEKAHFTELIPLQAEIRRPLHERLCQVRRKYIKAAKTCPEHERAAYQKILQAAWFSKSPFGDPDDVAEDYRAAQRHVDDGVRLMSGLRQRGLARKAAAIKAWKSAEKLSDVLIEASGKAVLEAALGPNNGHCQHDAECTHGPRGPPFASSVVRKGGGG